jgi:hypothetical protein
MWRNIICQTAFQLILLLILLFNGAKMFDVAEAGTGCLEFSVGTSSNKWNPNSNLIDLTQNSNGNDYGTITCATFSEEAYCRREGTDCYDASHVIDNAADYPVTFRFQDLQDYSDSCLTCKVEDRTLNTIIFNTFIYCQVFNEYTARNLFDALNPFDPPMSAAG